MMPCLHNDVQINSEMVYWEAVVDLSVTNSTSL